MHAHAHLYNKQNNHLFIYTVLVFVDDEFILIALLPICVDLFFLKSFTALLIASSANMEQCSFTGGKQSSLAMSVFFMAVASSKLFPFIHSVARLEEAMAEPHPKVLNLTSSIMPASLTSI